MVDYTVYLFAEYGLVALLVAYIVFLTCVKIAIRKRTHGKSTD